MCVRLPSETYACYRVVVPSAKSVFMLGCSGTRHGMLIHPDLMHCLHCPSANGRVLFRALHVLSYASSFSWMQGCVGRGVVPDGCAQPLLKVVN